MHDINKIAVDMTFTQITDKKGIKINGKRAISGINKYYAHL